jgi:hypothetical protein
MPLTRLAASDLAIVLDLAAPIERERRLAFLEAVAAEIEAADVSGPGAVFRTAAHIQRAHFDLPQDARTGTAQHRKPRAG